MSKRRNKGLKIKVIGCGGIGSWLVDPLCTMLSYAPYTQVEVTLIDGDTYEERNRERQNFGEIGPKATITCDRLKKNFARLTFWDNPAYLTDANAIKLIREDDIVVVCVDNHKTRKLISDRASELDNVTVISGGNELTDGNVLVQIRRDGGDFTLPLANKYHPELMNPDDKNPGDNKEQGCQAQQASAPQLVATNFAIAATMLNSLYVAIMQPDNFGKYTEVNVDIVTNQAKTALRK